MPQSRAMDLTADPVALCHREIPPSSPRPGFAMSAPDDIDRTTDIQRAAAGNDPIQVFAYGSLIRKPEIPVDRRTVARAQGCRGIRLERPQENRRAHLRTLIAREWPHLQCLDQARWIAAHTRDGPRRAITFRAGRYPPFDAIGIPPEEKARHLSVACGWLGSGANYLCQTVRSRADHGIHDPVLWRMQALVAAEIRARHGLGPPSRPA